VTFDQAAVETERQIDDGGVDRGGGEDARGQGAEDAADTVDADDVERRPVRFGVKV